MRNPRRSAIIWLDRVVSAGGATWLIIHILGTVEELGVADDPEILDCNNIGLATFGSSATLAFIVIPSIC